MVSLPKQVVQQLGLRRHRTKRARTAAGLFEFGVYSPVRLRVQGRDCVIEVTELPDGSPVLIGQVPLELMDWVVDPVGQRLVGNPDHGGEEMIDLL
jgi:predicted aspartyl protease